MRLQASGVSLYLKTWLGLIALAGFSLLLSGISLGGWSMPLALAVATVKGLLIALFFMHLAHARAILRVPILTALAFIVILASLMGADIWTRHDSRPPPGGFAPLLLD